MVLIHSNIWNCRIIVHVEVQHGQFSMCKHSAYTGPMMLSSQLFWNHIYMPTPPKVFSRAHHKCAWLEMIALTAASDLMWCLELSNHCLATPASHVLELSQGFELSILVANTKKT